MKIWIATADTRTLNAHRWAPVEGIITNPSVLLEPGPDWEGTLRALAGFDDRGTFRRSAVHVQVLHSDQSGILRELDRFRELLAPKTLICKIPVGEGELAVARRLARDGEEVNMTAVCSLSQLHLAAHAGARHVSIYVARINDHGDDPEAGFRLVEEGRAYLERCGFATEIIAASVRNREQYETVMRRGAHAVAAPPALLDAVLKHELTESSLQTFREQWEHASHG